VAADLRFGYAFPAIRGVQSGREYFASMCPLRLIPKIFLFDEDEAELPADLRAQRTLNRNRIPEIANYLIENRDSYVFSALTASIDAEVEFQPIGEGGEASLVGLLQVPMGAKFIINDGQHRRAAIEAALREAPELGDESIAIVFFIDQGLARCQQMFADLNRHGIRPSKSIGVLYDHRDEMAVLVRRIVLQSSFFKDLVETERSTLSARSRKLFTLSALFQATQDLLKGLDLKDEDEAAALAVEFWEAVADVMPEWQLVKNRKMSSGEVRTDFIHSHGVALHAIGIAGNSLIRQRPKAWKGSLKKFLQIDWARANTKDWEGRVLVGGSVSRTNQSLALTVNKIKTVLGLELGPEEERAERAYRNGREESA